MNFRTKIPISKFNFPIDYSSKIVSFGSCFAENMAEKFDFFKFQNSCNPFGILFHPLAIEKIISKAINYIWERFCETTISNEANLIMTEVESIQRGLSHRPFNPNSESHLKFINQLELKASKLKSEFPFMEFQL